MTATTLSEPYRTSGSEHTDSVGRRGYAIGLMIASSVVISFTGLIVRHVDADPMVMNFYRALSLMVAVTLILAIQYRRMAITHVIRIGWPGIVGGVMLTVAAISFLQSMTHTTVANTLVYSGGYSFFYCCAGLDFPERAARTGDAVGNGDRLFRHHGHAG
ncbi:MAG TPA: hypothetical protein EYO66_02290 [Gammaproteobacteria bacterium]|nr:hypothetical protein [Gammaproteobacteria bacterium]